MAIWRLSFRALAVMGALSGGSAQAVVTLTGDTNRPDISTAALGEPVQLTFKTAGMTPGQSLNLQLTVVDERGGVIETRSVPVFANSTGAWQGTVAAPASRQGFYRVNAQLSNGVKLASLGTRASGYLTYAVVPDPAKRVNYGQQKSFFGMQGGFGTNWRESALKLLGARWELDGGFDWRRHEPDYAGQWNGVVSQAPAQSWTTYKLPTLFVAPTWAVIPQTHRYQTGALTPAGETAWRSYVTKAVNAFVTKYPSQTENLYQVTWEPIRTWGYNGTDEQLLKIYEIAYAAIHAADTKAVVVGPTMGLHAEGAWPGHYERETQSVALFQKGLANYIDAFALHPYYAVTQDAGAPEAEDMVDRIRYLKGAVANAGAAVGKTFSLLGTEQGMADDGTPQGELRVAHTLIRQNLIMMGEGFDVNYGFYAVDYSFNAGSSVDRYGYFYNLVNGVPWGPNKAAPKPVAPAYAAQSFLLDGHDSAGALESMGGTKWGYRFQRAEESRTVQALWDYGANPTAHTHYTGLDRVLAYDWMGNPQWLTTDDGWLSLTLGQEPIYLLTPPAWNVNADGDWGSAGNWTTLVPNSVGAEAHFTGKIGAARSITVTTPVTAGALYFRNANAYTIGGGGGLTLDTLTGNALINVSGGRHAISTPLTLKKNLDVMVSDPAAAVRLSGALNQSTDKTIAKRGLGELALPAATSLASLNVQQGTVRLAQGGTRAMLTGSLLLSEGTTLDLADNDMVVRNGDSATITAELRRAFENRWLGPGIGSHNAHDDPTFLSGLGVLLNDNDNGNGDPVYTSFSGVSGLGARDVLVKYTWYGDANLNSLIDDGDYTRIDTGAASGGTGWAFGDFDYDGLIGAVDYALIDFSAASQTFAAANEMHAQHLARFGDEYALVYDALERGTYFTQGVPEPTTGSVLLIGASWFLRRRPRVSSLS